VNAAVQDVVDAFNLLPSVVIDQGAAQQASLLNNLVSSLNLANNDGGTSQAQDLARRGDLAAAVAVRFDRRPVAGAGGARGGQYQQ
jgi:hypothetical protein